jgi:hypothetical protein
METMKSMWGFIIGEFIPGSVMSLDVIMLIDIHSGGALERLCVDANIKLFLFAIMSIVFGLAVGAITFSIYGAFERVIFDRFLKIKHKDVKRNILDDNILSIKSMFSSLVVPIMLFGLIFPRYVYHMEMQPNFSYICFFVAFVFLCLALLHEKYFREGTGYYL